MFKSVFDRSEKPCHIFFSLFSSIMPNCSVHSCDYKKQEKGQYQSFPLPKDPGIKAKWVQKLQKEGGFTARVTENTVICSRHFDEEDFFPVGFKDNRGRVYKKRKLKGIFLCWQKESYLKWQFLILL